MPRYLFQCAGGHVNEVYRPLKDFTEVVSCLECGRLANLVPVAPALIGPESASARVNEFVYRQHNITRHMEQLGGGVESADPVSPADQCRCGNCSAHRRASPRTGTADVGKGV